MDTERPDWLPIDRKRGTHPTTSVDVAGVEFFLRPHRLDEDHCEYGLFLREEAERPIAGYECRTGRVWHVNELHEEETIENAFARKKFVQDALLRFASDLPEFVAEALYCWELGRGAALSERPTWFRPS